MTKAASKTSISLFQGLKSYSRADVEVLNRLGDLFYAAADWASWIQDALTALLQVPGKRMVVIEQKNEIGDGEVSKASFEKEEILIGRDPHNDIVLSAAGVGRRHARITSLNGNYFIEDLGSANGTFVRDAKLKAHEPTELQEGEHFLIFPQQFTFSVEQTWSEPEPVRVAGGNHHFSLWDTNRHAKTQGFDYFTVKVSPGVGTAVLGVSQDVLRAVVHRVSESAVSHLVPADEGLFEFLLMSVMERANRDLRFPFHFSLTPFEAPVKGEAGVTIESVVGLPGLTGAIEIFLPADLLQEISRFQDTYRPLDMPVSWRVMATAGHADLSFRELTELEVGDILLMTKEATLLLPSTKDSGDCGWRVTALDSHPQELRIEHYFERTYLMTEDQAVGAEQGEAKRPNLALLPVRVHVVISQLEMTLAELNRLTPGSIVELGRDKTEAVQLAVNGKISGTGELVEIDGRLGVCILSWTAQ